MPHTEVLTAMERRTASPDAALRSTDALVAGGTTAVEVTYSTPDVPPVLIPVRERYSGAEFTAAAAKVRG